MYLTLFSKDITNISIQRWTDSYITMDKALLVDVWHRVVNDNVDYNGIQEEKKTNKYCVVL